MEKSIKKFATEMDYPEFVKWAQVYVLDSLLESGLKGLRQGVEMVVNQAASNEVFGGKKKS